MFVMNKKMQLSIDFSWHDISLHLEKHRDSFLMNINCEYNYQLRAIIHYQSNLALCLRSPSEAAMTF